MACTKDSGLGKDTKLYSKILHSKSSEIILCRSKVDFPLNWGTRPQKNGSMKLFLINQSWFGSSLWLKLTHQKRHELD